MPDSETLAERRRLQRLYPRQFKDGMNAGAGLREDYPPGYHDWPLEKRNAFWAGANIGYRMAHPDSRGEPADE